MNTRQEKKPLPARTGKAENENAGQASYSSTTKGSASMSILTDDSKGRKEFNKELFSNLDGLIEVREISKDGRINQNFFESVADLNQYKLPQDKNVYVGMFSRDKERGQQQDTKQTQALWLDFDNVDDLGEVDYILDMKGLPLYSMAVKSGHGFHIYWLLDKPAGREIAPILRELARRTGADSQAAEIARVMRLPGTMNVKDEPVECKLVNYRGNRYKLQNISDILGVEPQADRQPKQADKAIGIDYEGIISEVDRPCIKSMLEGVEAGQRNWILGRLVKYFKNVKAYSQSKTRKIIKAWNYRNNPAQDEGELMSSFNYYWHENYNLLGCKVLDKDGLVKQHKQQILNSHCNKDDCYLNADITFSEDQFVIEYNNRLMNNIKKINSNSLIIYGVLAANIEGLTADRAAEIIGITKKTFKTRVKELINLGYVNVKKGIVQRGIPNIYYLSRQGTFGLGRTIVSYAAIRFLLAELNLGEINPIHIKLYMLLRYYEYRSRTNEVYPATTTLAEKLGTSRSRISKTLKRLEQRDIIEIDREKYRSNLYKIKIR